MQEQMQERMLNTSPAGVNAMTHQPGSHLWRDGFGPPRQPPLQASAGRNLCRWVSRLSERIGAVEMQQINNDVVATPACGVIWRKSRHSNSSGNCVEVAELADGRIAVRNSRYPGGPVLTYTRAEMVAFIEGAKGGGFDA
jgi:Domain of unknown function (DUF397)